MSKWPGFGSCSLSVPWYSLLLERSEWFPAAQLIGKDSRASSSSLQLQCRVAATSAALVSAHLASLGLDSRKFIAPHGGRNAISRHLDSIVLRWLCMLATRAPSSLLYGIALDKKLSSKHGMLLAAVDGITRFSAFADYIFRGALLTSARWSCLLTS